MATASIPRKEGFLKKQGHVRKNWKLRFFILEDFTLSYYDSRQSSTTKRALGRLFLQGATVEQVDLSGVSNSFQLKTKYGNKKYLNISGSSNEELREWMDALKLHIDSSVGAGNVKFSKTLLDFGRSNQTVDLATPIFDEFEVVNLTSKKLKFRFEPMLTKSYDLTFDPPSGTVSKLGRFPVKAKMVVNNPEIINAKAPMRTGDTETIYLSFKCRGAGGVFGCDPDTLPCEIDNGYKVPSVLVQMKRSLLKNNAIASEGIFRLAGDAYDIKRTKETLNKSTFDENGSEVNTVASLMKIWFRELPVPILNVVPKDELMNCGEKQASIDAYYTLPEPQKSLLDWLVDLLLEFAANSQVNKMSLQNIAIVVAPNLYEPPDGNPMEGLVLSQKCVQFFHNLMVWKKEGGSALASSPSNFSPSSSSSSSGSRTVAGGRPPPPGKGHVSLSAPTSPATTHQGFPTHSPKQPHVHPSKSSPQAAVAANSSPRLSVTNSGKIQRPPPPSNSRPRTQPPQLRNQLSSSDSTLLTKPSTPTSSPLAPKPLTPSAIKAKQKAAGKTGGSYTPSKINRVQDERQIESYAAPSQLSTANYNYDNNYGNGYSEDDGYYEDYSNNGGEGGYYDEYYE